MLLNFEILPRTRYAGIGIILINNKEQANYEDSGQMLLTVHNSRWLIPSLTFKKIKDHQCFFYTCLL